MTPADICKAALEIATVAHEGQTRWDGSPYVTHPIRVASNFERGGGKYLQHSAGLLHDVLEDTTISKAQLLGMLQDKGVPQSIAVDIVGAVVALTRLGDEPYAFALARVMENPVAMDVKMADLQDNLADLPPKAKGQMRDKYLLALSILRVARKSQTLRKYFRSAVDAVTEELSNAPPPSGSSDGGG
jgi:(p)ppGpp synthase/HD superfamily hydrolase